MKFIIWGHKLHESTHSYIHSSYKRALDFLGYETYWIDHRDDISSIDFSDAIFIVEHAKRQGMPFLKNCKYVELSFYNEFEEHDIPKENIITFRHSCDIVDPETFEHKKVEEIGDLSYWDNTNRILYQAWGTNLLPHEIDYENPVKFNPNAKHLNYVGMFYGKELWWWAKEFATEISNNHGVEFKLFTQSESDDTNKELIQKSFLCPDFRNDWHLRCGYIPCRIFKNISYGKMGITNNPTVYELFDKKIIYSNSIDELVKKGLEFNDRPDRNNIIRELMINVRDNHTYLNRINFILDIIKINKNVNLSSL